jgi:hypothetical protein
MRPGCRPGTMNPTAPAALDAFHHGAPIVWLRENPLAYPALEPVQVG